jgi:hypothetical protein
MAGDQSTPADDADEHRLSWRDRELLTALRRLANATAQVQALDAARVRQAATPVADPADVSRVEALESELTKLRAKAGSRFGGGAARDRLPDLEAEQRLVLERLGFDSYDAFRARDTAEPAVTDAVDPAIADFARRELAAAEQAYEELLSMPDDIDEHPAAPTAKPREDLPDDRPVVRDFPRTIDLRRGESSGH